MLRCRFCCTFTGKEVKQKNGPKRNKRSKTQTGLEEKVETPTPKMRDSIYSLLIGLFTVLGLVITIFWSYLFKNDPNWVAGLLLLAILLGFAWALENAPNAGNLQQVLVSGICTLFVWPMVLVMLPMVSGVVATGHFSLATLLGILAISSLVLTLVWSVYPLVPGWTLWFEGMGSLVAVYFGYGYISSLQGSTPPTQLEWVLSALALSYIIRKWHRGLQQKFTVGNALAVPGNTLGDLFKPLVKNL